MNEHTRNEMLVAQYVLGTLRGAARRRFEGMMEHDTALAVEVGRWQEAFAAMDATDIPVQPPGRVWRTIQLRLPQQPLTDMDRFSSVPNQGLPGAPAGIPIKPDQERATLRTRAAKHGWQLASFALAASLAAVLVWPGLLVLNGTSNAPLPVAVLLSAQTNGNQKIVASLDAQSHKLVLTPLNLAAIDRGHSLQLWLIAKGQKPLPLGLIQTQANTVVSMDKIRLEPEATLAISLEPAGGSPTGQPTGAVLYAGKVGKI